MFLYHYCFYSEIFVSLGGSNDDDDEDDDDDDDDDDNKIRIPLHKI